jgi:hypothetical protein
VARIELRSASPCLFLIVLLHLHIVPIFCIVDGLGGEGSNFVCIFGGMLLPLSPPFCSVVPTSQAVCLFLLGELLEDGIMTTTVGHVGLILNTTV